jgi:hypothetical protein
MDMILGILLMKSYYNIRALVDFSVCTHRCQQAFSDAVARETVTVLTTNLA